MSTSPAPVASKKHFQTILAGRKCYRMSKDKNEVVWPPRLEQALMAGLEEYKPAESKSPRGLTRFPNRNKFIAEYIYKTTGEVRTAKQVGSRIQQLRDTSAGKTIMKTISDRHYEMMHPTRPNESAQVPSGMGMSDVMFAAGTMLQPVNQVVHVYISVPPASSPWPAATETYGQAPRPTEVAVLSNSAYEWVEPRMLRTIDPTVTFKSTSPFPLCSSFTVYSGSEVVHMEQPTIMNIRETKEHGAGVYLHYTSLVPTYWNVFCSCSDLSQYTIVQEITRQDGDVMQKPTTVMMLHYHFNTTSAPPLSPFALNEDDLEVDYETDDILTMTPPGHAFSSSSSSSYRSDSPSYSLTGFRSQPCSQPLSPVDWQSSWAFSQGSAASHQQQASQLPTSGYYGVQNPQQPQSRGYLGPSQF